MKQKFNLLFILLSILFVFLFLSTALGKIKPQVQFVGGLLVVTVLIILFNKLVIFLRKKSQLQIGRFSFSTQHISVGIFLIFSMILFDLYLTIKSFFYAINLGPYEIYVIEHFPMVHIVLNIFYAVFVLYILYNFISESKKRYSLLLLYTAINVLDSVVFLTWSFFNRGIFSEYISKTLHPNATFLDYQIGCVLALVFCLLVGLIVFKNKVFLKNIKIDNFTVKDRNKLLYFWLKIIWTVVMIVFIVFSFLLSRAGFKANSSAVNQGIKEILQSRNTITAEDDTNVVVSKEFVNRFLGLREKMDSCTVDAVNNGYLLYDSLTDKNKIIKIVNDMHCRLTEVKTFFDRTNQFVKNFPAEMKTLYPQREDIESIALGTIKIYSDRQYVKKIEEMISSLTDYFEKSDELYSFILEHFDSFNVETRGGTTELVFLEGAQDIENQYYKLLNETLDTKDVSEKAAQAVTDYFLAWSKDHGFDLDINQFK